MIVLVLIAILALFGLSVGSVGEGESTSAEASILCEPESTELPCLPGVERDVPYSVALQAHCGIEWAYFTDATGCRASRSTSRATGETSVSAR